MNGPAWEPAPKRARVDWSRVTLAVQYAQTALQARFNGDGLVRGATHRGWLRNRLRELLDAFPDRAHAQRWVRAACFKARGKANPMAYFVTLVSDAATKAELRDVNWLLSLEELHAWGLEESQQQSGGSARGGGQR